MPRIFILHDNDAEKLFKLAKKISFQMNSSTFVSQNSEF